MSLVDEAARAGDEARAMRRRTRKAVRARVPLPDLGGWVEYPIVE
ncbi:hypothetical protein [Nocardioides aquiterrae]|uniref:Uncharacterized protein n=1 Tax=Nocardioides aquiterrae TaxID=203799 RepID=A0ABN1UFW9_9ACTN